MKSVNIPDFGCKRIQQDCSNTLKHIFIEIPPFAKDDKGNIVNDNPYPVLRSNGEINIQDEINSYRDDCDLYQILDRVAKSQDFSLLNVTQGAFMDVSNAPRNINEIGSTLEAVSSSYSKLTAEEQTVIKKLLGIKVDSSSDVETKEVNE